ncbi:hypothetical protein D3C75_857750 [compost metagenome]
MQRISPGCMCREEFKVSSPMPVIARTAPKTCGGETFFLNTSTSITGTKITVNATRKPAFEVVVVFRPKVMQVKTPSRRNPSKAPYFRVRISTVRRRLRNNRAARIKASPKRSAIRLNSPRDPRPIFMNI